jgi:hypothetical protein
VIGSPAAWIVGMPALGSLASASWRIGWLAFPLAASLAALVALRGQGRPATPSASPTRLRAGLRDPLLKRWLLAELAGQLGVARDAGVRRRALRRELRHRDSRHPRMLALAAVAFALGNLVFRRFVAGASREPSSVSRSGWRSWSRSSARSGARRP